MSFGARTPESLIARSDSKNPTTTCRGLTTNGRPCRKALASKSPVASPTRRGGVLTLHNHHGIIDAGTLYCHHHKNQAPNTTLETVVSGEAKYDVRQMPIRERASLDSLVHRLEITSISDSSPQKPPSYEVRPQSGSDNQRINPPKFATQTRDYGTSTRSPCPQRSYKQSAEKPVDGKRKQSGFWAALRCISNRSYDDDYEVAKPSETVRPTRPTPAMVQRPPPNPVIREPYTPTRTTTDNSRSNHLRLSERSSPAVSSASVPLRQPLFERDPSATNMRTVSMPDDTNYLLTWIPSMLLPPHTVSKLLGELSKPISSHDEEGYIYMYWLTDSTKPTPSADTAASLLSPPTQRRQRQLSDVMSKYSFRVDRPASASASASASATATATATAASKSTQTVLLKIGRTTNVHRRMNQWQKQCGYTLSLLRYYPYTPSSSPQPSFATSPGRPTSAGQRRTSDQKVLKVRHATRVERLVHLELAQYSLIKEKCSGCNQTHREWFAIEATGNGVNAVDEVIKRWVQWVETVGKAS